MMPSIIFNLLDNRKFKNNKTCLEVEISLHLRCREEPGHRPIRQLLIDELRADRSCNTLLISLQYQLQCVALAEPVKMLTDLFLLLSYLGCLLPWLYCHNVRFFYWIFLLVIISQELRHRFFYNYFYDV